MFRSSLLHPASSWDIDDESDRLSRSLLSPVKLDLASQRLEEERDRELDARASAKKHKKQAGTYQQHLVLISKEVTANEFVTAMKNLPALTLSTKGIPEIKGENLFSKILNHPELTPRQKSTLLDDLIDRCNYSAYLYRLFEHSLLVKLLELTSNFGFITRAYISYRQKESAVTSDEIYLWRYLMGRIKDFATKTFDCLVASKDNCDERIMQFVAVWLEVSMTATDVFAVFDHLKKNKNHFYSRYKKDIRDLVELRLFSVWRSNTTESKGEGNAVKSFFKSSHPFFSCCATTSLYTIYGMALQNQAGVTEAFAEKKSTIENQVKQDLFLSTKVKSGFHL